MHGKPGEAEAGGEAGQVTFRIIVLLCPILFMGGAVVASLGMGSHRRPERRAWKIVGGFMMALGLLFGVFVYAALHGLPGLVF